MVHHIESPETPSAQACISIDRLSAEEVKYLRKQYGKTQAEFAAMFGISLSTVRKWEQGCRTPGKLARNHISSRLNQTSLHGDNRQKGQMSVSV